MDEPRQLAPDPTVGTQVGLGLLIRNCSSIYVSPVKSWSGEASARGNAAASASPERTGEKNDECVFL